MHQVYIKLKNQNATIAKLMNSKFKDLFLKSFEYLIHNNNVPIVHTSNYNEDMLPKLSDNVETYDALYAECKKTSDFLQTVKVESIRANTVVDIDGIVYVECFCDDTDLISNVNNLSFTLSINLPYVVADWVNHKYRDNDDLQNAKNAIYNIVPMGFILWDDNNG